ncbi:hypothetical protein DFJ73DRAFT_77551 [Zopfochytrium polystomum]|nr:hypothetical protein DFJ73DRAFT_77551 [Zopfochytrium polystomum]
MFARGTVAAAVAASRTAPSLFSAAGAPQLLLASPALSSLPSTFAPSAGLARIPATLSQVRHFQRKKRPPPKVWTRPLLMQKVLDLLFDYARVPEDKVNLDANLANVLLIDRLERYGLFLDALDVFEVDTEMERRFTRDLASGRELADWISSLLEESGRLNYQG